MRMTRELSMFCQLPARSQNTGFQCRRRRKRAGYIVMLCHVTKFKQNSTNEWYAIWHHIAQPALVEACVVGTSLSGKLASDFAASTLLNRSPTRAPHPRLLSGHRRTTSLTAAASSLRGGVSCHVPVTSTSLTAAASSRRGAVSCRVPAIYAAVCRDAAAAAVRERRRVTSSNTHARLAAKSRRRTQRKRCHALPADDC